MTAKSLLAGSGLLFLLTACGHQPGVTNVVGSPVTYGIGLTLAVPPFNTILFGPCKEEFGMPDSRKADCEIHYHFLGEDAPWEARAKYLNATAYQPGELSCTRTRGKIVDCSVVSGPPHSPPDIAAPNNLGAN